MGGRIDFGQSVSQTAKISFGDIPHDPLKQNVFASVLAEALCKDKSKAEIADMMRFLQILCSLMKSYMI